VANYRLLKSGKIEIYARLYQGESFIVSTYKDPVKGDPYLFYDPVSKPVELSGTWKVDFIEGGEKLPAATELTRLTSWTDFTGEDGKNFSGTASYTISFTRPKIKAEAWSLNLGRVCESASVSLNGKELGSLIGPDFQVIIDKKLVKAKNTLVIKVSNLMANRIAYMDRNNIEWKIFYNVNMAARLRQNSKDGLFDASSWQPMESGLLGPVTITPVRGVR
jgi:hypothetical protein